MGVHAAGDGACLSECLYDGHSHPFLWLRDGTHPLAVGTVNPGLLSRPGRSDWRAGGCQKSWGPADRSSRRTDRAASADSEVRPGPRLPTLRPYHAKTAEAGPEPEALPTSSLPIRRTGRVLEMAQILTLRPAWPGMATPM